MKEFYWRKVAYLSFRHAFRLDRSHRSSLLVSRVLFITAFRIHRRYDNDRPRADNNMYVIETHFLILGLTNSFGVVPESTLPIKSGAHVL